MIKIVIIGNSAAGFSACEALLKNPLEKEITVISQEDAPAYKRNLLVDYLFGNIKEDELFLCPADFYEKNKIKFLKNIKVARVDTKKQAAVLKDNTKINYDYLIIAAGEKAKLPDIPGTSKDGVFSFYNLEDARKIKERLMVADTICVAADATLSQRILEALMPKGKTIKVISRDRPQNFTPTEKTEWIDGFDLTEIIGEGAELKAFKLSNGKAIGTSLVLFAGNYLPSTDFLKETELKTQAGYIIVDQNLRTNFENIFSCGSVCRNENNLTQQKTWDDAVNEGVLAATNIINLLERGEAPCQRTS